MNYAKMAKHFLFERGANGIPSQEDAEYLAPDGKKYFTQRELEKLAEAINKERERWRQRLIDQRVIEG